MTKLTELGFAGPYTANADGSVNGVWNGNPYNIHKDATSKEWEALQADIASKAITVVPYTAPAPVVLTPNQVIQNQISALERQITARRLREATLTDAGKAWLTGIDAQITALRAQRTA